MASISTPVGLRDLTVPTASRQTDQETIIGLLAAISAGQGGRKEVSVLSPIEPGTDGNCPLALAQAIHAFQTHWIEKGEFKRADGVVDIAGNTLRKLNQLAPGGPVKPRPAPAPIPPVPPPTPPGPPGNDVIVFGDMTFEQVNPPEKVNAHEVSNRVIEPLSLGFPLLMQSTRTSRIHELRFRVTKPGGTFWVGVGVPEGTVQFGRAFLFFHPTPVNGGLVRAADSDYPKFVGGWVNRIEKYMVRNGGQLALARKLPLVLPYMTMASARMEPRFNVFADRPLETIAGVLAAARQIITGSFNEPPLSALSTGSFSSGATFHNRFLKVPGAADLVFESMDFDSTFIRNPAERMVPPAGVRFLRFTQMDTRAIIPDRIDLPPPRWRNTSFPDQEFHDELPVHNKIGFMTYWAATLMSVLV